MRIYQSFFILFITIVVSCLVTTFESKELEGWKHGRATFYGDMKGGETMRKLYILVCSDSDEANTFTKDVGNLILMKVVQLTNWPRR